MEPEKANALVEWFATKVYNEEINIVPEDLGLENPREKFADDGYDMNKDDHCWCEITGAKVVDDTEEFEEEDMSFEEFVMGGEKRANPPDAPGTQGEDHERK